MGMRKMSEQIQRLLLSPTASSMVSAHQNQDNEKMRILDTNISNLDRKINLAAAPPNMLFASSSSCKSSSQKIRGGYKTPDPGAYRIKRHGSKNNGSMLDIRSTNFGEKKHSNLNLKITDDILSSSSKSMLR